MFSPADSSKARLPSGLASIAIAPPVPAAPPSASAPPLVSSVVVSSAVEELLELLPPQATSASEARIRASATAAFFMGFPFRAATGSGLGSNWVRRRAAVGSPSHESRLLAAEEGGDAVAHVLGAHRVGDAVALELQMLGQGVLDAAPDQQLRHPHIVRRHRRQLLGLGPGTRL